MAQGRKTGGRTAGTPNKATATIAEQVEQVTGGEPLPVLLARIGVKAMKDQDYQLAIHALSKAAGYAYPRLQSISTPDRPVDLYPVLLADERGMARIPDNYPGPVLRFERHRPEDSPTTPING